MYIYIYVYIYIYIFTYIHMYIYICSRFPVRQPPPNGMVPQESPLPAATYYVRLPTTCYSLLPIYYLLPTTTYYYLLPTTNYYLPQTTPPHSGRGDWTMLLLLGYHDHGWGVGGDPEPGTYTYIRIHKYTYIKIYINTYIHIYIYTCIHFCMFTYVYIYIHTYAHVFPLSPPRTQLITSLKGVNRPVG